MASPSTEKHKVCLNLIRSLVDYETTTPGNSLSTSSRVALFKLIDSTVPCLMLDKSYTQTVKVKVDTDLVPFNLECHKPHNSVSSPSGRDVLSKITRHCANSVADNLPSVPLPAVDLCLVSRPELIRSGTSLEIRRFLDSPCKRTYVSTLAKKQHANVSHGLSDLVKHGFIRFGFFQKNGRGLYCVEMKQIPVSGTALPSCDCCNYQSGCLLRWHRDVLAKHKKEEETLRQLLKLLPVEVREEVERKRTGSPVAADAPVEGAAKKFKSSIPDVVDLT